MVERRPEKAGVASSILALGTIMKPKHVLVVDDEKDIRKVLEYNLKKEGYEVSLAATGEEALAAVESRAPDLVVLDLMLPGTDGLEVCRILKSNPRTRAMPVLMLTAKGSETDQVVGLELGADDYVTKPFALKVLLVRIKKLLQRRPETPAADGAVLKAGAITLEPEKRRVLVKGKEVALTALEFRILAFLMARRGRVFSRDEVLSGAWKHEAFIVDRTVDVHVKSIRRKLGPAADCIETVRGSGYRFKETPA